jgi:hypothetical protein
MKQFVQCKFTRGNETTVGWIPKEDAKKNSTMDLKINEVWSKKWTVQDVGTIVLNQQQLITQEQGYKNARKATDI